MRHKNEPLRRKLIRVILLTCSVVLFLTYTSYFIYEYFTFREVTRTQVSTLGKIVAANSTAALAFDSRRDAVEILEAFKAEKNILAASLYDENGGVFAKYPATIGDDKIPRKPGPDGYKFSDFHLEGFQSVVQGDKFLGTLYIQFDMATMYARLRLYGMIAFLVIVLSFVVAYFLSNSLQKTISQPILQLTETAKMVSDHHDYSVRAEKTGEDEIGVLTDAFNHMLTQIEVQNSEIRSFNQQLEQKVKARTVELENANGKLEVVNEKLVRSNSDLEQFAYVASHDLQEPLRKIQIFTEMAEKTVNNDASATYFEKIHSSARRMTDLIKSVLNYSRLSKTGEQFEEVDLNQIVENTKTDFELLITEKKAVIKNDILPVIEGIPLQLNQLFLNLFSNSLKFSSAEPLITISSRVVPEKEIRDHEFLHAKERYIEILFKDNGIGFEQQYADQIFTIFQRLHDKRSYEGTGIGLALCKKIVENHHGFITAKSELGKGAAFYIYLPA
ncbi:MAG: ATP-binding protein [Bacteroidota bacterium]